MLLPGCEYNPGPVSRPRGHLRVMKSSQLRLQPGLTGQGTSWLVSRPRRPETRAPAPPAPPRENARHTQQQKTSHGWGSQGKPVHTQRQDRHCLGASVKPLGCLGQSPQPQVISNLECVPRMASKLPPLCRAQFYSVKVPPYSKDEIEELGVKNWGLTSMIRVQNGGLTAILHIRREGWPPAPVPVEKAT